MGFIRLLFDSPELFFMLAGTLLYSIVLHEIAHGAAALAMGDRTAKDSGRLSLNPLGHIAPLGALALLLIGFGWAKPVPVNPNRFRLKKTGIMLVALAGSAANIAIAALALTVFKLTISSSGQTLMTFLLLTARINILLAAFNLMPIPPLDGSKVLMECFGGKVRAAVTRFESLGIILLMGLMLTGLLSPVIDFFQETIFRVISLFV